MKFLTFVSSLLLLPSFTPALAEETDSIPATQLDEVVVEAILQSTDAKKTTYLPTSRQKSASQSGADLIDQMGVPQLKVSQSGTIETNSGKKVAVFIDFIPATQEDLKAMRMSDVRKVEYYEFPSDPRLQGNQFVVNYIMAKYEDDHRCLPSVRLCGKARWLLISLLQRQRSGVVLQVSNECPPPCLTVQA